MASRRTAARTSASAAIVMHAVETHSRMGAVTAPNAHGEATDSATSAASDKAEGRRRWLMPAAGSEQPSSHRDDVVGLNRWIGLVALADLLEVDVQDLGRSVCRFRAADLDLVRAESGEPTGLRDDPAHGEIG